MQRVYFNTLIMIYAFILAWRKAHLLIYQTLKFMQRVLQNAVASRNLFRFSTSLPTVQTIISVKQIRVQ
jgi:hypothetical protein